MGRDQGERGSHIDSDSPPVCLTVPSAWTRLDVLGPHALDTSSRVASQFVARRLLGSMFGVWV